MGVGGSGHQMSVLSNLVAVRNFLLATHPEELAKKNKKMLGNRFPSLDMDRHVENLG